MKLMFKGFRGRFTGKPFLENDRRANFQKWGKRYRFPLLATLLCTLLPLLKLNDYEMYFLPIWREVHWSILLKMQINATVYFEKHNLASSANLYRFTNLQAGQTGPYLQILANCPPDTSAQIACWGERPQSPLNVTCGVGCAFILNTSFCELPDKLSESLMDKLSRS